MTSFRWVLVVALSVVLVATGYAVQQQQTAPGAMPPQNPPAPTTPAVPPPVTNEAPETQTLHILTGRSVVINLQTRLRRVLVSNPAVLETITTSPTQLVATAKAPGSSSLVLFDETGHSRILDVYADSDVSGLRDALQQAFPGVPVQVEAEQGRIVVSGSVPDKAAADEILKMAQAYSKDVVNGINVPAPPHAKQILLKVRFAEVNRNKLDAFGFNLVSTGAANTVGAISTQQFSPPASQGNVKGGIPPALQGTTASFSVSDLLNIFVFRPDVNLAATIRALQTKSVLEILAEPNLMAVSGRPATFLAGGEFPFPVVQGGGNVTAVTIQFRQFGVKLDFTGTIGPDNVIHLKVAPEVSALDFANALTVSGFVVPAMSTRRAETEIELRDGQSFGIAGLLDNRTTAQLNKIPGIGDIPILGQLFRSRSISRSGSELMVLVTPTIVDPVGAQLPPPKQPEFPLPYLDQQKFDRDLPKGKPAPATTQPSGQ